MVIEYQPHREINKKEGPQLPWSVEALTELFKSYDTNKDGKLSQHEVREAFKNLGSRCSYYRTRLASYHADLNRDGYINLANGELSALVKYVHGLAYKAPTN